MLYNNIPHIHHDFHHYSHHYSPIKSSPTMTSHITKAPRPCSRALAADVGPPQGSPLVV